MLTWKIKDMFFDRAKVRRAAGKAKLRVLGRAGAKVRKIARSSMRKRKGPAPPGQPPHVHKGTLKRLLLFGYDRVHETVLVGSVGLGKAEAPGLQEFGGKAKRVRLVRPSRRGNRERRKVTVVGKRRPYMRPALEKVAPELPRMWRCAVKEG